MRTLAPLPVLLLALVVAGCGGHGSSAPPAASGGGARPVVVDAAPAPAPAPSPAAPTAAAGADADAARATTPQDALARFAKAYINWSWRDVVANRRALARVALDPASTMLRRAAAAQEGDYELRTGRITNSGTVVSIAPAQDDDPGTWVVVTRERTGADKNYMSLPAAYHVTLATVVPAGSRWVVSSWEAKS